MKKNTLRTIPQTGYSTEKRDDTAEVVAEIFHCSPSYVRKLISGTRKPKNDTAVRRAKAIIKTYHEYQIGKAQLKNNLIKAVERLIA